MKNIKQKLANKTRRVFIGSIMQKSSNYLPLTNREKAMSKWFVKFQLIMVFVIVSWISPLQAIHEHLTDYNNMKQQISHTQQIINPVYAQEVETTVQEQPEQHIIISQDIREVSAYNAGDPNQTDDTPCISANNENICVALEQGFNRCAANFVEFGTELLIEAPNSDWSFQCLVVDRMNKRYQNRVDIAMTKNEKQRALNFGVQNLIVSIIE